MEQPLLRHARTGTERSAPHSTNSNALVPFHALLGAKDCGGDGDMTDSIAWSPEMESASQENRVPTSWLPSSQPPDGKKRRHPIRTDMLLVFSCLAG